MAAAALRAGRAALLSLLRTAPAGCRPPLRRSRSGARHRARGVPCRTMAWTRPVGHVIVAPAVCGGPPARGAWWRSPRGPRMAHSAIHAPAPARRARLRRAGRSGAGRQPRPRRGGPGPPPPNWTTPCRSPPHSERPAHLVPGLGRCWHPVVLAARVRGASGAGSGSRSTARAPYADFAGGPGVVGARGARFPGAGWFGRLHSVSDSLLAGAPSGTSRRRGCSPATRCSHSPPGGAAGSP